MVLTKASLLLHGPELSIWVCAFEAER